MRKLTKFNMMTFFKSLIKVILIVALVDIQLSYILAFLGKEEVAIELSDKWLDSVVKVVFIYAVKAFFGKFCEELNKIKKKKKEMDSK